MSLRPTADHENNAGYDRRLPLWCLFPGERAAHGRITQSLVSSAEMDRSPWLIDQREDSSGPASIEVRLLGAILVAVVGWIVYDVIFRH